MGALNSLLSKGWRRYFAEIEGKAFKDLQVSIGVPVLVSVPKCVCFIVKVLRGVPCGLLRVNSSAEDSFILVDKVENYRLCCRNILGPKAFLAPRFRECVQLAGTILLCTLRFKLMRILLYNPVGKN